MDCLVAATVVAIVALASTIYVTIRLRRLEAALRSTNSRLEETVARLTTTPARGYQPRPATPSEPLERAVRLQPVAYVRGGIEIGARPGYRIRFVAGELVLSYYDERTGEPKAARITLFRRGKGTYVVIQ